MMLDASYIKANMAGDVEINVFDSVTSTNDILKDSKESDRICICLAEQQTEGRGRLNRSWYSPSAQNIYLSCAYPFKAELSQLSGLSLAVSLAVFRTLKTFGLDDKLSVKWPNDILYDNKKISGSLIEVDSTSAEIKRLIIGIGINVNMQEGNAQISQAWTSMQNISGRTTDRNMLCVHLIDQLLDVLQRFQEGGFALFIEEWMQANSLINQMVTLKNLGREVTGVVVGVNAQGQLLLRMADGEVCCFSTGDCSASVLSSMNLR